MSFRQFMELEKDDDNMISVTADQLGIKPKYMKHIISTTPDVVGMWGVAGGIAKNIGAYVADMDDDDSKDFPTTVKLKQINGIGSTERNYKMDKKGRMVRLPGEEKDKNMNVRTDDFIKLFKKGLEQNNQAGGMGALPGRM